MPLPLAAHSCLRRHTQTHDTTNNNNRRHQQQPHAPSAAAT